MTAWLARLIGVLTLAEYRHKRRIAAARKRAAAARVAAADAEYAADRARAGRQSAE